MLIDRRTLTGAALAATGAMEAAAGESDTFDEGLAVERVFDGDGRLVQVAAGPGPGQPWVRLLGG